MLLLSVGFVAGRLEILMKAAGFLILLSGWVLVAAALVLLPSGGKRVIFLLAGLGVEILGLVLAFRSHLTPKEDRDRS
jgi:hypothetical protein